MVLTELWTARRLIGKNRGHHKRNLRREHPYALRRRVMVEVVPVTIPDIQDTLRRDTLSIVGKDLISSHHLDQRDLGCTECHRNVCGPNFTLPVSSAVIPMRRAILETLSTPANINALIAGMLREVANALRIVGSPPP